MSWRRLREGNGYLAKDNLPLRSWKEMHKDVVGAIPRNVDSANAVDQRAEGDLHNVDAAAIQPCDVVVHGRSPVEDEGSTLDIDNSAAISCDSRVPIDARVVERDRAEEEEHAPATARLRGGVTAHGRVVERHCSAATVEGEDPSAPARGVPANARAVQRQDAAVVAGDPAIFVRADRRIVKRERTVLMNEHATPAIAAHG